MPKKEAPYIKKYETLDDITVWIVDGEYIRNNINREFTNFGQHYRFPFIPTHEFWLDFEHSKDGEERFYIDHLLVEWHLMRDGKTYDYAIGKADDLEQKERARVDFLLKAKEKIDSLIFNSIPSDVYVKKMGKAGNLEVCIISGRAVRDLYFIDFTEGGHHFIYDFVPLNEVWIDDDLTPDEREYVLLHELHERFLMAGGMDYAHAHASSSAIEYKCRRNPKLLKKCLDDEVEKNSTLEVKA